MKSATLMAAMFALTLAACGDGAPLPAPKAAPPVAPPAPEAKAPPAPKPAEPAPPSADQALADRVKQVLRAERAINAEGIDISVKDGVVTLFGTADSKLKREIAAKVAAAVPGVKSLENKIAVVAGS